MSVQYLHMVTYSDERQAVKLDMLKRNFKDENHFFVLIDFPEGYELNMPENRYMRINHRNAGFRTFRELKEKFKEAEFIIWHGVFVGLKWMFVLMNFFRFAEKKYVWISQGTDLYQWRASTRQGSPLLKLRRKIYNRCGEKFRKKINYFGAVFPSDKYYYIQKINPYGRTFDVSYRDIRWGQLLGCCSHRERTKDPSLKIMVGLNGSPLNNHAIILDSLIDLCCSDSRVYLFLGGVQDKYAEYKETISNYAELMLGDKAIIVDEIASDREYVDLLEQMDMIVTGVTDPVPLNDCIYDAVTIALAMQKPVFLSKNSSLYRLFQSKHVTVYQAESISSSDFEKIRRVVDTPVKPAAWIETRLHEYGNAQTWKNMFLSLESENRQVKFLHIIRPSVELATPIMEIVQNYFDIHEHIFLANRRIPLRQCEQLMQFPNTKLFLLGHTKLQRILYMYRQLKQAEHIVWHGFYVGYGRPIMDVRELLMVRFCPKILDKITWVAWGSDIYDWKADIDELHGMNRIKAKIFNRMAWNVRSKVRNFVTIFPPDADTYRAEFGDAARIFDGTYSNIHFREMLEATRPRLEEKQQPGDEDEIAAEDQREPLKIMVGHSANYWNYHIASLHDLEKFRCENIKIYIPLSTGGDKNYINEVEDCAYKLFGSKAVIVKNKMPLVDYIRFLWSMDIVVFRLDRQAALGNLMNLFYMSKKIYLPAGTVLYEYFKSRGVAVYDTNRIKDMSFDEFIEHRQNRTPSSYILERTDPEQNAAKWKYIFDEISAT